MKRHLHLVELRVLPLVHGDGAHEGEVDAEAAVLPAALQADPDAVGHGHPLRVVGAALEAPLKCESAVSFTGANFDHIILCHLFTLLTVVDTKVSGCKKYDFHEDEFRYGL